GAWISLDHALDVVAAVMGERLDGREIAGFEFDRRLERLAEVAPMHRVGGGRDVVMRGQRLLGAHGATSGEGRGRVRGRAERPERQRRATDQPILHETAACLGELPDSFRVVMPMRTTWSAAMF